jgi:SOS-response transcriptional repressor LexA
MTIQMRVAGFLPSTSGFHFDNAFSHAPDVKITILGKTIGIGDAANGLCGGMVFAARDYFDAGIPIPSDRLSPTSGPLFDYIVKRLLDSFNLLLPPPPPPPPFVTPTPPWGPGPLTYMWLMDPGLPDHETFFSQIWLAPHGRAWIMINEQWPNIKQDIDNNRLSPIALVEIKSLDPTQMGQNHQVLAYGYDLTGTDLSILIYDPNYHDDDGVRLSLSIADPQHTTAVTHSRGAMVHCFFQPIYAFNNPTAESFTQSEDWTHGAYYGSKGTYFADVDGDGKADAIVVNDDKITVRRSTGASFGPNEDWTSNPFFGTRGTYFADVTGDGLADAIAVNDDKIIVRRSTGAGFGPPENWTPGAFYGTRGTYFADVDGDGKVDAIVVNDDTVTVRRSTGNGFGPPEDWTHGAYYGSRGIYFADVDGDGKADAIVVNDGTVTVRRSIGASFGPNEDWTHGPYYGTRGTYFADVTGDKKTDAIVVNDNTVTIRRSTGTSFRPNEDWTHGPYYGSRGTYFADVTGDGKADAIVVNDDTVTVRRAT